MLIVYSFVYSTLVVCSDIIFMVVLAMSTASYNLLYTYVAIEISCKLIYAS